MSAFPINQKTEALVLLFGIVPWTIAPAFAEVAKLLWPNNLPVFVLLAVLSLACAIAAIKAGRANGGTHSRKAAIRWGYWLGCGYIGMLVTIVAIVGPFAVWLFLWPK